MLTRTILEQLIFQNGAQTVKLDWFLSFFNVFEISCQVNFFTRPGGMFAKFTSVSVWIFIFVVLLMTGAYVINSGLVKLKVTFF